MATQPTDLRKSYDGLSALVEGTFERDLTSGDMFVFINRRAT
ncbi:MAG: IS66 family insertion sequence element accessory protein TnpB, partial [Nannocystaceae bacterium]